MYEFEGPGQQLLNIDMWLIILPEIQNNTRRFPVGECYLWIMQSFVHTLKQRDNGGGSQASLWFSAAEGCRARHKNAKQLDMTLIHAQISLLKHDVRPRRYQDKKLDGERDALMLRVTRRPTSLARVMKYMRSERPIFVVYSRPLLWLVCIQAVCKVFSWSATTAAERCVYLRAWMHESTRGLCSAINVQIYSTG